LKEVSTTVKNKTGLHARPAALIVSSAAKFKSTISVKKGEKEVNLKSLLSLLSLGICNNDEITIKAVGIDENEAIEKIISVLEGLVD
jgi:phosphotransferase system HPr (HPr) family protein